MAGWTQEGDALVRDFELDDFAGAMAFVNKVAELAEEANHHRTSSSTGGTRSG